MQQSPHSLQSQSLFASAVDSAVPLSNLQQTYAVIPRERPYTPLLDRVDSPADLKAFSTADLIALADELRLFVLYSAGQSGGHFGANLGVIELTIALHYLLDAPQDQIVWDVGHQAYAHKVLTGRRDRLGTIRSKAGLTAFPERAESVYDTFGVGHSSTSISAGLGMSLALRYQGRAQTVACIIGDGAMTGGMAFEAMNDAVQQDADLMVILNDNDMSISCSIGGFSRHLAMLWESGYQVDISDAGEPILCRRPDMQAFDRRKRHKKQRDVPQLEDNLFKAIGFTYFGPFDGHNIPELLRVLSLAKQVKGPVLVHIYTTKGKGFAPAELDPVGYHAIGSLPAEDDAPKIEKAAAKPSLKYSQVFGQFLCDKAVQDNKLLAITPAMEEGSGMIEFARQFPERFFDVAIAEQHAVTLAGGMATQGVKPIVAIYSTFLQRGYDQLIHDVALQNLDVMFAIDRAGLVGEDGATHAGVFDFAFLRCVPNMMIAAPKDENECYHLLNTCYEYQGCTAVRYPRGVGTGATITQPAQTYNIGKAVIESVLGEKDAPKKLALLAFGTMVATAQQAAEMIAKSPLLASSCQLHVVNMRWVKPLDTTLLEQLLLQGVTHIATLEEHTIMGGAGSAVNEYLLNDSAAFKNHRPAICNIGIPDRFVAHGSQSEQWADCGLDVEGVVNQLQQLLS
ncbi:1-deoxy-D-xylulose-5-phosphate synthase [Psychrobacter arcticus 273-4]|uniref:1-deoxy-D-xylulose-5-phosphate synthase n=1 Tax=Psychrobacter arcticus (strain DSM 17307 / VKM B-2377 / 273-4) TaxID=259536 RepID=DXS_PSYA2|nr:1-deoxy-D-xylulose-5-phosphate synthase [Psychrobacter arcticus]Q4FV64.1 RecName: Full=1-deoxy-D-xylulose-5-phosphate synthase; AltName: Full=1-deoxyxylulose-5-phosphate synthase; Short=DXP synthase; Short=DXPS [Psychrobacter arcticus 273-4]AAZ18094.1 1-deoxy-D-xylulose-5-phosphate synthase [Psychrobacter arcticus 273-4]